MPSMKTRPHPARPAPSIFEEGRNCYRAVRASRASVLVDADNYFNAFVQAASAATKSILILAWDFNSRTRLTQAPTSPGGETVGEFLNRLVKQRRGLRIHVLNWDYPMIYGTDREFPPIFGTGWTPARGVQFRYDNTHAVGGSHHQKIVVIDDAVAFTGGLDLTTRRWDTCDHKADEPRRSCDDAPYPPFHDVMALVDGEAARALADIARERWKQATGETLRRVETRNDPWPAQVAVELTDVTVGVSRTAPAMPGRPESREVEALYLDMIARATRTIYIENQYFTSHRIGDALAARLAERDGPEVVVVSRLLSHGWLEENTMHALRTRLVRALQQADKWQRFGIYYPHVPGLSEGTCVDVHSKVMTVDDEWLRVGSANVCNRSMGMDTECDVTFEAAGDPDAAAAVTRVRNRLVAEHLGVSPARVEAAVARKGSLNGAIRALHGDGRSLRPLESLREWPDAVVHIATFADPEKPVQLDALIKEFKPDMAKEKSGPAWGTFVAVALVFAALTAVWRFTPLGELVTADRVIEWARDFAGRPWAPIVVLVAYTPACFIMFPRPLITLFSVVAFGAWLGFAYAMSGILIAAVATYYAGRLLSRSTVRRLAGKKLNEVSEVLRKRGLVACTALRLVPVAPFAVEGLVAGAIRIKLFDFTLGTAIGILPGTLATTVFGDQLEAALRDPSEINYWLVAGAVLLLVVAILIVRKWFSVQIGKQRAALSNA